MGDFYDVIPVEGGFGVVIGDVCGKGAQAARTTALARSAVRTAAHSERDPAAVLHTLNDVLHIWFGTRRSFLTATYSTFTRPAPDGPPVWAVAVAAGGHPPGFVRRADGSAAQLDGGGQVLGITTDCPIHTELLLLNPGDSVVFYTDGITEARRPGDRVQFDEPGVHHVLSRLAADADADAIAAAVADTAYAYAGDHAEDDSGVVVIRILPP